MSQEKKQKNTREIGRQDQFPAETMLRVGGGLKKHNKERDRSMLEMVPMLAQAAGGNVAATLPLAFAGLGAGIGVGICGGKAAEAVGRNPSAFGNILVMAIIGMALAEAIAIYGLIIAFTR
jgi:F-type H+-transporting ATPase subunit c